MRQFPLLIYIPVVELVPFWERNAPLSGGSFSGAPTSFYHLMIPFLPSVSRKICFLAARSHSCKIFSQFLSLAYDWNILGRAGHRTLSLLLAFMEMPPTVAWTICFLAARVHSCKRFNPSLSFACDWSIPGKIGRRQVSFLLTFMEIPPSVVFSFGFSSA